MTRNGRGFSRPPSSKGYARRRLPALLSDRDKIALKTPLESSDKTADVRLQMLSHPSPVKLSFEDPLPRESAHAFAAFCEYRELPSDERSIRAVAEIIGKAVSLIERWSSRHQWVKRVRDHDSQAEPEKPARELKNQRIHNAVLAAAAGMNSACWVQYKQELTQSYLDEIPILKLMTWLCARFTLSLRFKKSPGI